MNRLSHQQSQVTTRIVLACLLILSFACGDDDRPPPTDESSEEGGGTGTSTSNTGDSSGSNNNQTNTSTSVISTYLTTLHSSEISGFESDDEALSAQLAANGQYLSGGHYTQSKDLLLAHIQSFVDASVTYVHSKAPVDSAAVKKLMNDFRTSDKSYADSYYADVNWGSLSGSNYDSFIADVQADIDTIYDLAIGKLP